MSDEAKITALEGALRDAVRLRVEAEVKLEIAKAEQTSATDMRSRAMAMARAMVELWYACRKDSDMKLSKSPLGRRYDFATGDLISIAEDDVLQSVGVKVDVYSAQRELEARLAEWKAVVR